MPPIVGGISPVILDTTIGRESEIESLLRNTMQGRHTLLIGRNGIGKTHLLLDLQRRINKPAPPPARAAETAPCQGTTCQGTIHYVRRPVPAKEIIDSVYSWLCITAGVSKPRKVGHATRIVELGHMIAEVLALPQMSGKKIVLLLDEFDQLPVLAVPVIEVLTEKVAIVAAARNRHRHPRFNRLFWRFEEISVNPLSPQHARELAAEIIRTIPGVATIDRGTKDFLLNQIATLSNGVPSAIVESADRLRSAERIDKPYIRELFVHRSGNTYFDAAPLILTFFAFLVIMRYINRGMYQFDMYAIFGALSGMMLLVRWFMMRTSRGER